MYARVYKPGETILNVRHKIREIMFIMHGQLGLISNLNSDGHQHSESPFCILPTKSYFGDFFVLRD